MITPEVLAKYLNKIIHLKGEAKFVGDQNSVSIKEPGFSIMVASIKRGSWEFWLGWNKWEPLDLIDEKSVIRQIKTMCSDEGIRLKHERHSKLKRGG